MPPKKLDFTVTVDTPQRLGGGLSLFGVLGAPPNSGLPAPPGVKAQQTASLPTLSLGENPYANKAPPPATSPRRKDATVNITWNRVGPVKKIVVKRRLQSLVELKQLEKERQAREEIENADAALTRPPPTDERSAALDTTMPEDKLKKAKTKLFKKLGTSKTLLGLSKDKSTKKLDAEKAKKEEEEKEKPSLFDVVFKAKVRSKTEEYEKKLKAEIEKEGKNAGLRDWPAWLQEYSKPRLEQARGKRLLDAQIVAFQKDPDLEHQLKQLVKKEKGLALPGLTFLQWANHVPMPAWDKRLWSVKPNMRQPDYFRFDSIGWTPEDKYIQVLKSPQVEKVIENYYELLKNFLVPASVDGQKKLGIGEKVKVLELGSGSGEHAVMCCQRNKKEVIWQATDVSNLCVNSINARAKFVNVLKNNEPENVNGNMFEAFRFDILNYEKAVEILDPKWKSLDMLVCMHVIPWAPLRFLENLFKFGNEVVKMYGTIFITGPFKIGGVLTEKQEKLDLHLRMLSPKFGIRDLDDMIALAKDFNFLLDLKFDMEEGSVLLLFKKTPPYVPDEDVKVVVAEDKKEGDGMRKERPSRATKYVPRPHVLFCVVVWCVAHFLTIPSSFSPTIFPQPRLEAQVHRERRKPLQKVRYVRALQPHHEGRAKHVRRRRGRRRGRRG